MNNVLKKLSPHIKFGLCLIEFEINADSNLEEVWKEVKLLKLNDEKIASIKINKVNRLVSIKTEK